MTKLLIGIPAFNEALIINKVLKKIPKKLPGIDKIETIIIDDGSTDRTYDILNKRGYRILRHVINLGLGASIGTLFAYAKTNNFDIFVTMDADGQHEPNDIGKLISGIVRNKADVVIGSRLVKNKLLMPFERRIVNYLANLVTFLISGIWSSDSQSGFRAFSKNAIEKIEIITQRMEVSSEIFREIKHNKLKYMEIPIDARYTEYSLGKGQKIDNALNVLTRLIIRWARR